VFPLRIKKFQYPLSEPDFLAVCTRIAIGEELQHSRKAEKHPAAILAAHECVGLRLIRNTHNRIRTGALFLRTFLFIAPPCIRCDDTRFQGQMKGGM
jgi:hypothetical protein